MTLTPRQGARSSHDLETSHPDRRAHQVLRRPRGAARRRLRRGAGQHLRPPRLQRGRQDHVVKILSTLLKADGGTATVNGYDVATQAAEVRESISLTGQFAAVDEILTGRENLVLVAKLRHVKNPGRVADELLARFSLTDAGGRRVATYSGGMRRRLDIAMSLIGNPPVIFLDEPTTGLDPQARIEVWQAVKELAQGGTTVLLTTQYLDEAEQLADRIAILHEGRIIANGTLAELKQLLPATKVEYVEKQPTLEDIFLAIVGTHNEVVGTKNSGAPPMNNQFLGDTAILLGRSLRHIVRSPDTIITTAITPIAMLLLFVYVFGGAIDTGGVEYVNYLLPGILLITVASGIAYTAYRLFTDVSGGIFERFQSMPIARSAVLWGHVLTSVVANLISLALVVLVAVAMGFRSGAGVLAWLGVVGILVLFTLALTWLAVIPGLTAKSADAVRRVLLPADLPAVHQLGLRAHRRHARPGALVRRAPARHPDRQHAAQPLRRAAGRQRHLDRARLVRRPPGRRLPARGARLRAQDRLTPTTRRRTR